MINLYNTGFSPQLPHIPVATMVSSLPWVKITMRCLFELTFGRACVFLAISLMSSVSKPCYLAKVAASTSFPKSMSTKGITFINDSL